MVRPAATRLVCGAALVQLAGVCATPPQHSAPRPPIAARKPLQGGPPAGSARTTTTGLRDATRESTQQSQQRSQRRVPSDLKSDSPRHLDPRLEETASRDQVLSCRPFGHALRIASTSPSGTSAGGSGPWNASTLAFIVSR